MKRNATAVWTGTGKEGSGHLTTQSGVLHEAFYSHSSRFADGTGTNPEELIAAAHAGCFSMKLSFVIGEGGFTPEEIRTTSYVSIANGTIGEVHLDVKAKIPGATAEKFQEMAENAKVNCPVSKLLNAHITMTAELM